ncbi:guanine nucleotide-binding protein subunit beta-like protein 1 isoform X2 [Amphibalanus amphitrite]|uniref:guanine nucleotide-binding protein subunit beta-like protein 1 isoform X2 n=1 Tax=Amphibalanus amphitrite TaxID=1232801 RepID=UPI001C921299|nr:guanine nucleotide-binding protein subunit beta-like protein 1 isoform X2 [Amphibalanus amphitrite]
MAKPRATSRVNMKSVDSSKKPPPPPLHYFKSDGALVTALNFLVFHDEAYLAQGSQDGNLTVWDLKSCERRWSVAAHSSACRAVEQLESGHVVTQGRNDAIRLWDVDSQQPVASLPFIHHGFCRMAVVGGRLACPSEPASEVALLDPRSGAEAGRLAAPAELGTVMALAPLPGAAGARLLAVYESGGLLLWDPAQPCRPADRLQVTTETPMCVDAATDGRGLVGTSGTAVPSFSVGADGRLQAGPPAAITNPGVASVRLRPDGRLAALGCWDGRLRLVSGRRLRLLAALEHHTATVECVQFAPRPVRLWKARALLASGSADGTAALWKVYDDS